MILCLLVFQDSPVKDIVPLETYMSNVCIMAAGHAIRSGHQISKMSELVGRCPDLASGAHRSSLYKFQDHLHLQETVRKGADMQATVSPVHVRSQIK